MKNETKAIRIQTERTNEMEHSTPLFLTSSFCFDNAEEMRAAFADEQKIIFIADLATLVCRNLLIKWLLWKGLKRVMQLLRV